MLTWRCSYETLLFNTPDGDIDRNEYAVVDGAFLVRRHPKNNAHVVRVEQLNTTGMTEVSVVPLQRAYYAEFVLPSGRRYRERITRQQYFDATTRTPTNPRKDVTAAEIADIVRDDASWQ